ncbi:MAG: adenylate/guanylate cyclase domain-containing protein [Elusimicrobia bacterium]|nr:adenylate/guanylate cyclase domain-containing protein [Elusimicrobiota bacterium]
MAEQEKQRKSKFPLYFTIVFTAALLLMHLLGSFYNLDNKWFDTFFRIRGMESADSRLTLVAIDDTSIAKIGQYPWPRRVYAKLLKQLFALGVKVVGFDIQFPDKSGSASDDEALVKATREAGDRLVHAIDVDPDSSKGVRFRYPFESLRKAAKQVGLVNQVIMDQDGMVRETPLVIGKNFQDSRSWLSDPDRVAVFGLRILSVSEGRPVDDFVSEFGNIARLNIRGSREFETNVFDNETKQLKAEMRTEFGIRRMAAWRVMEGQLSEEEKNTLKGGIAVVGSIAVAAFDHFPTPFDAMAPGAEVHLNLMDNLLNKRLLHKIDPLTELPLIAAFAAVAFALTMLSPLVATLLFLVALALWLVVVYSFFLHLHLLACSAPTLALAGVFIFRMLHRALMEEKQKREMRQMFGQYVSPEVVDILVKDPSKIRLGGDKRDMTIFFLDIAHFTTISEKMTPENLIKILNTYLTELTDVILENKGAVDKYIGDCIMAFWNAPVDVPDHRARACTAAVECIEAIRKLNDSYVDPTIPEKPAVRIGLNSGEVVVGNTGSARKLAYTVLGDDVNLASRLEGANKFFGSTVMASESTFEEGKAVVEARVLGSVRVVGKAIPIKVFELLAKKGQLSEDWRKALPVYEDGVQLYLKREFEKAKGRFEEVLKLRPGDKPSKLYLSACQDYAAIPPPADWDGVFNLSAK